MFLDSTVFSPSGALGTFTYEKINGIGSTWPSDYYGYHFDVISGNYWLSSDRKECTVTLRGMPVNADGLALGVYLTSTHTFDLE